MKLFVFLLIPQLLAAVVSAAPTQENRETNRNKRSSLLDYPYAIENAPGVQSLPYGIDYTYSPQRTFVSPVLTPLYSAVQYLPAVYSGEQYVPIAYDDRQSHYGAERYASAAAGGIQYSPSLSKLSAQYKPSVHSPSVRPSLPVYSASKHLPPIHNTALHKPSVSTKVPTYNAPYTASVTKSSYSSNIVHPPTVKKTVYSPKSYYSKPSYSASKAPIQRSPAFQYQTKVHQAPPITSAPSSSVVATPAIRKVVTVPKVVAPIVQKDYQVSLFTPEYTVPVVPAPAMEAVPKVVSPSIQYQVNAHEVPLVTPGYTNTIVETPVVQGTVAVSRVASVPQLLPEPKLATLPKVANIQNIINEANVVAVPNEVWESSLGLEGDYSAYTYPVLKLSYGW